MDGWDIVVKIRSCYHNIMYNRKDDLESWRRQERLGEFLVKNVGTLSIIQKTTLKKQYFLICLILISINYLFILLFFVKVLEMKKEMKGKTDSVKKTMTLQEATTDRGVLLYTGIGLAILGIVVFIVLLQTKKVNINFNNLVANYG